MSEKKIRTLTSGPMVVHNDIKIAVEVLKNCEPERIIRKKGTTTKFYYWDFGTIVRIDFTNRCKNISSVKVIK